MKKTYEYEIVQDTDPTNPREWDNIATMICGHKRYNLGDKHDYKQDDFDSWEEIKEQIESDYKVLMIKPLYMYDHSGITIRTSSFGCPWDSGQIGWIFIDEKKLQYITGDSSGHNETNLEEIIDSEVKTYDQYITGECYGYKIYEVETCSLGHEHKTELDSCWGYYDEDDCTNEAKGIIEHYQSKLELC
jgi:hypothetical protein